MGIESHELTFKASSGTAGLDFILAGGFPRNSVNLVQGQSGTGKTTLGLQFLLEGVKAGERCLFISLLQRTKDLSNVARAHGWSLEGIHFEDISAVVESHKKALDQTVFRVSGTALTEAIDAIAAAIDYVKPQRLVFDAVSEIRVLADNLAWYRNQILLFIRLLTNLDCTTLLVSADGEGCGHEFRPLVDGVISLEQLWPEHGRARRRLQVVKMRGMDYQSGYHDFRIITGGVEVFPQLKISHGTGRKEQGSLQTGVSGLDSMLGGGLRLGSTCLVMGASGTGKSTLATLYVFAAAQRGHRAAIFLFNEDVESFLARSEQLGMDLAPFVEKGIVRLRKINVGEVSPGELAQTIRRAADSEDVKILVIDSLDGYYLTMPEEAHLLSQMHELVAYLNKRGVLSLLLADQRGVSGKAVSEPRATSLLSDAALLLRRFEAQGVVKTAISVFKKRYGPHDKTVREMHITSKGVDVGGPLESSPGVLLAGAPASVACMVG